MSKTYDMLAESLNEIITDYEVNNGANLTHEVLTVDITPARKFSGEDVRSIRQKNHLTQSILAKYLACFKTDHSKVTAALKQQKTTPTCSV